MKAAQSSSGHCSEGICSIVAFTTGTHVARSSPQDKSFRDSKVWWMDPVFGLLLQQIIFVAHSVSWAWRLHFPSGRWWWRDTADVLHNYKALCCVKSKLINICSGSEGVIWCIYWHAAVGDSWVFCLFTLLRNNAPDFQTWSITR